VQCFWFILTTNFVDVKEISSKIRNIACCIVHFIIRQITTWWWSIWRPKQVAVKASYVNHLLLTAWCRVLLQKLTVLQLVKKFPAFHGTRRFITALTSVHQLSLSWASPIQSIYPHPTSWRSILILSTHLRLGHLLTYSLHGAESFFRS